VICKSPSIGAAAGSSVPGREGPPMFSFTSEGAGVERGRHRTPTLPLGPLFSKFWGISKMAKRPNDGRIKRAVRLALKVHGGRLDTADAIESPTATSLRPDDRS